MNLALYEAITRALPHAIILCSEDGTVLSANPPAITTLNQLRVGANLYELAQDSAGTLRTHMGNWLRSGSPLPGALLLKDSNGSAVRFRCHGARASWWPGPGPAVQIHLYRPDNADRFVVLSRQVTDLNREIATRRKAEAQQEDLLRAEQATRARLQRLYRLTAALAASATLDQVARAVHETATPVLDVDRVTLELHSQRLTPALEPGEDQQPPASTAWSDLDQADTPPATAPTTALQVPLEADGLTLGTLTIDAGASGTPEPAYLTAVAQQIAQAVRRAGLYEHEHRVAERLQLSLLPQLPKVEGLEVAARYAAGSDMVMVGGDWYDVYDLDADHIAFSIGDVAGHGLPQAAVMAQIIAALRGTVVRCGTRPQAVISELNGYLHRYHPGQMATACYLLYHRPTRTLRYVKAGHPPPLVVGPDGSSRYLDGPISPPVGPVPGAVYQQAETTLTAGDAVLLYTDGLIERPGEPLDEGLSRLSATARQGVGMSVDAMCELFLDHRPDINHPDDRALLLARPTAPFRNYETPAG
ncbi:SpoIIE family protein phosphatase [Streptomyces sp. NBC_00882]|uniref:SpoIIE family protein phosphatase n=1 Tax=Streptomyces sp. NBC_00882 TaxID=2975856 RepID=UPI0038661D07|nr:SpoIIE family protein phosphatase [Streptomyces sp. NBC_00882]